MCNIHPILMLTTKNKECLTLPDEQSESSDNQSSSAGPMARETTMVYF